MTNPSHNKKVRVIFFGRSSCKYSKLMIKFFKKYQNVNLKIIISKSRNQKLSKNQLKWKGDYIICFRSYYILPQFFLNRASAAAINFHSAPLNCRGSGGVNFSLFNDKKKFSVVSHIMNNKLDSGSVIDFLEFKILKKDNLEILLDKAHQKTFKLFQKVIKSLLKNNQKYLTHQIKFFKKKKIKFNGSIKKISQIDKMQEIKKNYSKNKIQKIIRSFHLPKFPVYIKLFNYKFYLKL